MKKAVVSAGTKQLLSLMAVVKTVLRLTGSTTNGGHSVRGNPPRSADVHWCGCHLGCHSARIWRGWMGIEPTQDASQRPANGFEDRGPAIRRRP